MLFRVSKTLSSVSITSIFNKKTLNHKIAVVVENPETAPKQTRLLDKKTRDVSLGSSSLWSDGTSPP
ncbi:hypothetical protein L596_022007 [Steinernema carpocapsae]|uniref:Uncharacterized protein n=1 Tax=Steinernema carpocapsae TaxID=34508 RepID=A0A4U5MKI9_STECR|nr:hypothetical protein L596_022007 [Steinernema carpocapsae]